MQLPRSVHCIELKLPFQDTPILNVYVIDGGSSSIAIDSGMGDALSSETLIKGIEKINLQSKSLSLIVNTHEHIEHFSGNYALVEATGAQVAAHPIAAQYIEKPTKQIASEAIIKSLPEEAAKQLRRWSEFFKLVKPTKVDRTIQDGDAIETDGMRLKVIHTPGHARGHICLYDEEKKVLFSGDQVLGTGTPYVGQWPDGSNGDMGDYLGSLEKLKQLDIDVILPSHGPVITQPYKRIDETIERKLRREEAILGCLKEGNTKDVFTLAKQVYNCASEDAYYYSSCILAYLSKLRKEGKVEYSTKGFEILCRLKK